MQNVGLNLLRFLYTLRSGPSGSFSCFIVISTPGGPGIYGSPNPQARGPDPPDPNKIATVMFMRDAKERGRSPLHVAATRGAVPTGLGVLVQEFGIWSVLCFGAWVYGRCGKDAG